MFTLIHSCIWASEYITFQIASCDMYIVLEFIILWDYSGISHSGHSLFHLCDSPWVLDSPHQWPERFADEMEWCFFIPLCWRHQSASTVSDVQCVLRGMLLLKKLKWLKYDDILVLFIQCIYYHFIFLLFPSFVLRNIEVTAYIYLYDHYRLYALPWDSWWTWILCALGTDLGYYWVHRMAHEINFMWAGHQVHHSSEDYNLNTALRQSVLQRYSSWVRDEIGLICFTSSFMYRDSMNNDEEMLQCISCWSQSYYIWICCEIHIGSQCHVMSLSQKSVSDGCELD